MVFLSVAPRCRTRPCLISARCRIAAARGDQVVARAHGLGGSAFWAPCSACARETGSWNHKSGFERARFVGLILFVGRKTMKRRGVSPLPCNIHQSRRRGKGMGDVTQGRGTSLRLATGLVWHILFAGTTRTSWHDAHAQVSQARHALSLEALQLCASIRQRCIQAL